MLKTIRAKVRILSAKEGGKREWPVSKGYRPIFRFDQRDVLIDGGFDRLVDRSSLMPGEECEALIRFHAWEYVQEFVVVGTRFEFTEAYVPIGCGEVLGFVD